MYGIGSNLVMGILLLTIIVAAVVDWWRDGGDK